MLRTIQHALAALHTPLTLLPPPCPLPCSQVVVKRLRLGRPGMPDSQITREAWLPALIRGDHVIASHGFWIDEEGGQDEQGQSCAVLNIIYDYAEVGE